MYKKDFPIFSEHPSLIYLDSAATTQKPRHVIDAVSRYLTHTNSNIHRGAYDIAIESEDLYTRSKQLVSQFLHCKTSEIIYSFNATYAFNLLVGSLVRSGMLARGDRVLIGINDHHANVVPWLMLRDQGIDVDFVMVNDEYVITPEALRAKLTSSTKVVSLSMISNVTGAVQDLSWVKNIIGDRLFFVDASQGFPHLSIDVNTIGCDGLVFTAHKVFALTGLGVLYLSKRLINQLVPSIGGGASIKSVQTTGFEFLDSKEKFEPGTPNVVAAVSLGAALEYIESIGGIKTIVDHDSLLVEHTLKKLEERKIKVFGPRSNRIGIFSLHLPNAVQAGEKLAEHNICVRAGLHCAHPLVSPIGPTIRMSLYLYNTIDDIDQFFFHLDSLL